MNTFIVRWTDKETESFYDFRIEYVDENVFDSYMKFLKTFKTCNFDTALILKHESNETKYKLQNVPYFDYEYIKQWDIVPSEKQIETFEKNIIQILKKKLGLLKKMIAVTETDNE